MTRFNGNTVLITGGALGIGRRIAERCIDEQAARIILWDIDEQALDATATELRARGGNVEVCVVDVSKAEAIERGAGDVLATGPVGILFNNAGVVVGKSFAEHTRDEIERSIRVNVLGVMHVARAFIPAMIDRGSGHIVNIASAAGLVPNPNMSVYASSKWAVLGWSESLRLELEGGGLHVTTVCPSYIATGMFTGARAPLLTPMLRPEVIVDRIVRAVRKDRILLRAPRIVYLLPLLRGLLPARVFDNVVGRGFGIYSSMDKFTGRTGER